MTGQGLGGQRSEHTAYHRPRTTYHRRPNEGLHCSRLLPLWAEGLLALAATAAGSYALALRARAHRLLTRLESREREGHLLGESPDTREILRRAFEAALQILPLSRFDLYRIDATGRVEEVWSVRLPDGTDRPEPLLDSSSPHLGERIDSGRLLQLTATETERSFAPKDLLAGGPDTRRLRLPLYSGDRLIAHLDLTSPQTIDDARKAEIRALLGPLTASLHALRNWSIAVTDELSGLVSRRYFETRLAEEWARRERSGAPLAVACFDLDHFKQVNDSLGHAAGDRVIRRFGEIARAAVRTSDVACRYGGEEFAILFPDIDADRAGSVAERIRQTTSEQRFVWEGRAFAITVSAGVAQAPGVESREQLLLRADKALYAAKEAGRNRVIVWEEEPTG